MSDYPLDELGQRTPLQVADTPNMDELAKIISEEHGKTLDDARGSVTRGLEVVEFSCG